MTGKELIIYILQNNLEDEEIIKDGKLQGFLTAEEVAAKFDVGVGTVKLWVHLGMLKGIAFGDSVFFPRDVKSPMNK